MSRPAHLTSLVRKTYYDSYGTPRYIIDGALKTLGIEQFDFDMASSASANEIVDAKTFCSAAVPFEAGLLLSPWFADKSVWCNPPGPGHRVTWFWNEFRAVRQGAFLLFSLDHIRNLIKPQRKALVCVLRKRVKYIGGDSGCSFPSALVVVGAVNTEALDALGNVFEWV